MINEQQFASMIPTNKQANEWYQIAIELFPKYQLNTANRISGFMAQAAHESGDFKTLQENLNYSEAGLLKTFGKYFTKATAKQYARKPEMIANHVYDDANRTNKLGNTQPGDGWRFRGRGIFQLTGRSNYEQFGKSVGMTADEVASYLETKKGAFESALWFWNSRNLNRFADRDDIVGMSEAVNGGQNGLQDRIEKYARNKQVIGQLTSTPTQSQSSGSFTVLQRGTRGNDVATVQTKLGLTPDGIFGILTEAAVRSWQRSNKFPITGKIDKPQFDKMVGK